MRESILYGLAKTPCSFAQDEINTTFYTYMNYVFAVLEKNRIPNRILLDYTIEFTNLLAFNEGLLVDSNHSNYTTLSDIYSTLITSRIYISTTGLIKPIDKTQIPTRFLEDYDNPMLPIATFESTSNDGNVRDRYKALIFISSKIFI